MPLSEAQVQRIIEGEHPMLLWCEYREISIDELARRADLSADFLHKVVAGQRGLKEREVNRLAAELGIKPCDLQNVAEALKGCLFPVLHALDDEDI